MRNPFDVSIYLVGNILEGIFIQLLRFDLHEEKNEFLFEFRESRSFYDAIYYHFDRFFVDGENNWNLLFEN